MSSYCPNLRSFLMAVLLLIPACGIGLNINLPKSGNASVTSLTSISISPATPYLSIIGSQQLSATGHYSDGSTKDLTDAVTWAKQNVTGSATLTAGGLASAAELGTVSVTATLGTVSKTTTLTVIDYTITTHIAQPWWSALTGASPTSPFLSNNFWGAWGIAIDSHGNIFLADVIRSIVWKIYASTGTIAIFAGDPKGAGYSGDGGLATNARLQFQSLIINGAPGLAVDSNDNLYICDNMNNAIRMVSATTGIITTVAGTGTLGYTGDGGLATNATLDSPTALAVDSSGNLYIADGWNHVIRKVTALTGVISTIAGDGTPGYTGNGGLAVNARIDFPTGIVRAANGDLYISDSQNSVIRKITNSDGRISTYAGNGVYGYTGDGGLATAARLAAPRGLWLDASSNLYIADSDNNAVRLVSFASGNISTVAGGSGGYGGDGGLATSAQLCSPVVVALDSSSNLYISDSCNAVVRRVANATGNITTFAGMNSGTVDYLGDGGPAISSSFAGPSGIALDAGGNLYVSDASRYVVRKVNAVSSVVTTIAGNGTYGYTGDGGPATSGQFSLLTDVVVDSSGNLYVADIYNHVVRKINSVTGNVSTFAGNGLSGTVGDGGAATSARLIYPEGLALDSSDNLYISDVGAHVIRKVNVGTGIISKIAGTASTAGYAGDGGLATSATLDSPRGIAIDSDGNIYIADANNNVIRRVSAANGNISTVVGTGAAGYSGDGGLATAAQIDYPYRVAVDANGNLFVAESTNDVRLVRASTGTISTIAGINAVAGYTGDGGLATSAKLENPVGIAVSPNGDIYIADSGAAVVRKLSTSPLQSLSITPLNPSLAIGTPQQFEAVGTFADGSSCDLSKQLTWSSDTPGVATITSFGWVDTRTGGTATISATTGGVTSNSITLEVH